MIVAIHQPNYFPWLGYFQKILLADTFLFLDDVQFSKNSYTNRVQICGRETAKWMTIPVTLEFGDPINAVHPAKRGWVRSHLDQLRTAYGGARSFSETWAWIQGAFENISETDDLATVNRTLAEEVAHHLGLLCTFAAASDYEVGAVSGADRLVALVLAVDSSGTYLSGSGGAKYQDKSKFEEAKVGLSYRQFKHPQYDQGRSQFTPGLSVLDALFHLGPEKTMDLLRQADDATR